VKIPDSSQTGSPGPAHPLHYSFTVGESYTRAEIFAIVGVEDLKGGPWYTGYAKHDKSGTPAVRPGCEYESNPGRTRASR